jgi:hypothetical protein
MLLEKHLSETITQIVLNIAVIAAKYGSINAAQRELGDAQAIRRTFVDFQQHLYAA